MGTMRLLILTQKIDINDSVLGFFHRWVEEFAKHCEKLTVIALGVGEYHLPENVRVLSLGKEKFIRNSRYWHKICILASFYKYIWQERKNYDAVFVHMNQEYVILGAVPWKLFSKKIFMWRNHYAGSFLTGVAAFFCDKVFCTSRYSYTARYKKTEIMPVGIDTNFFKEDALSARKANSILFLGRMSPSKKPHLLIEVLSFLQKKGVSFSASFYGDPDPKEKPYYLDLKKKAKDFDIEGKILFYKGVPNKDTVLVYNQHEFFVNLSSSGMLDKTIFESMACGAIPVVSTADMRGKIPEKCLFEEGSIVDLADKIQSLMLLSSYERMNYKKNFRDYVIENHSLELLVKKFFNTLH